MSYQAVREVVEQVLYLQTVADASLVAETSEGIRDDVKVHWQKAVEDTQARVDELISELEPSDRHVLQRLTVILQDRLHEVTRGPVDRPVRKDGGVEIQGFGDDATVTEWEHGHG